MDINIYTQTAVMSNYCSFVCLLFSSYGVLIENKIYKHQLMRVECICSAGNTTVCLQRGETGEHVNHV